MFEDGVGDGGQDVSAPCASAPERLGPAQLQPRIVTLLEQLAAAAVGGLRVDAPETAGGAAEREEPGAALIDLISGLAGLVSAAEACSARATFELDALRRRQEADRQGKSFEEWRKGRGQGVAAEVGLARRESGHRGQALLGLAKVLCGEMPHTLDRLAHGDLTPWRAHQLVKESACLDLEDRRRLDEDLCGDPATLHGLGDRAVAGTARRWCAKEDPASVVARQSNAESERRVWLRPAPDTMAYLTALVPVADGVAAFAALSKRADSARAAGDERTRGQVMADALVAGVTGSAEGEPPAVLVNLVMTDTALFSGGVEPALLPGFGPVPASSARDLVARAAAGTGDATGPPGCDRAPGRSQGHARRRAKAFVRRLYVAPDSGALVAMDARTRTFPKGLAELIKIRDGGTCRTPWCDAPIRHIDHVVPAADGGPTSERDGQGGCEAHNYAKQAAGWAAAPAHDPLPDVEDWACQDRAPTGTSPPTDRHRVVTTTPSGHTYSSTAPPLPGTPSPGQRPRERLDLDDHDSEVDEPEVDEPEVDEPEMDEPDIHDRDGRDPGDRDACGAAVPAARFRDLEASAMSPGEAALAALLRRAA